MKKLACLTLALAAAVQPLAMAADQPAERRQLQFVQRVTFFGAMPREFPIELAEPTVTYRVRPLDGQGDSFSAYGYDNPFWDTVMHGMPVLARHHPLPGLRQWTAASQAAANELALADEAAAQEDTYRLVSLGLLIGGLVTIGYAAGPDDMVHRVLGWSALGLFGGGLITGVMGGAAGGRSVNHIGRAVWFWNNGQ